MLRRKEYQEASDPLCFTLREMGVGNLSDEVWQAWGHAASIFSGVATFLTSEIWKEVFGQEEANLLCIMQQSSQPAWQPQKCIAFNDNLFPILIYNKIFGLHQAYNVLGTF